MATGQSVGFRMIAMRPVLQRLSARLKSRFVRDVVSVGGGIAIAQAITLAFTPLLTRLFAPEAFGASAAYAAILNIILPLATLGYANAIVMPKTDEGAAAVARLSILSGLFLAPISLLLIFALKPLLASWTGLEDAPWVLYFIPVSIVVSAFLSVANQAAIREGLFKEKARAYVESTLLTNVAKAGAGFMWPTGLVLIVLTLLGKAINTVMQLVRVRRVGVLSPRNWWGWRGVREAATAHRDFALYRMPQSVIRAASIGIPVVVLTKLFGTNTAGQYSITVLLMSAPVMLLGNAVGEVFYPKITRTIKDRQQPANRLILRAIGVLLVIGAVPFGIIALFGNVLLPWLLGKQWQLAGAFSQWVSIWMIAMLVSRPAVSATAALGLQGALLIYEVLVTSARILALYMGARFGGPLMAISAFTMVNMAGYIVLIGVVIRGAAKRDEEND